LTDRDTIVVADFVNKTGEEAFDGTLQQGLAVQLEQSPFLSVVSRERVQKTLREMMRPANTPVVEDVAREICERTGAAVAVNGTIVRLGDHYVVGLDALQCQSGSRVAGEQVEVADREHVLRALGRAATDLRRRLGESRATLERFNKPLPEATTARLEALKAFTVAEETRVREGELRAEPLYKRAIELDPDFALAYARLSTIYGNTGQGDAARSAAREAYARRDRVTEVERLYIEMRHCVSDPVPDDRDCYARLNALWVRTYPRNALPHINLCRLQNDVGEFEAALQHCDAAMRLDPDNYMAYTNLVRVYAARDQFDEALATSAKAIDRGMSAAQLHEFRYMIGFVRGDGALLSAERQALAAAQEGYRIAGRDAEAAAFEGRFRAARELTERAEQLGSQFADWRAELSTYEALIEAAAGFDCRARTSPPNRSGARLTLAIAALLCGEDRRANALLEPWHDLAPVAWPPLLVPARALLALHAGDARSAERLAPPEARELTPATRYRPPYIRGIIYLWARDAPNAIAEFQRIIDHRGIDPTSGLYPLAYAQQARAYVLAGEAMRARNAYERFFELWKDADADVPILKGVKTEYARLTAATH